MSGLTRLSKDILDLHDSDEPTDAIAAVLRVRVDEVRAVVRAYAGTGSEPVVLDDLLPGRLLLSAPADGRVFF